MAQRILVLEKDTTFLRELEVGFSRYDAEIEVVPDGDASVAKAKSGPTALVMLSVDAMSAASEAFLVCKRFKSDDELAKIPLVIMGGAPHVDSFEAHKKLKRRADEYIKLPIPFDELISKLSKLVSLAASEVAAADDAMDVDADIDAFADNAFDDLLQETESAESSVAEAELPSEASARPAVEDGSAAQDEEISQLKQQLERLTARAETAEKRAEAAEKKSAAAAPRGSSMAPPGAGVSSRDYLEMREQLNRKDKELLALRDEITSRDRQLLDGSDKALELERAQAGLHDELSLKQRNLEDAQSKIKAYETDREAVAKRLEDLKGRLSRAEDKTKKLETDLDAARTQHASEISEAKAASEHKLAELEATSAAESARLRASHAVQVSDLEAKGQAQLEAERSARADEVAGLKTAHEGAVSELRAEHARTLESERTAAETKLGEALADAAESRARALAAAAAEHAEDLENKLAAAESAKGQALEAQRKELEARQAAALKDAEDKHGKELAILGRKLSEAESRSTIQEERIQDLEHAKQELETNLRNKIVGLEQELAKSVDERDRAQNELSAARASIASHERTETQQAARVAELEEALQSAERQVQRQAGKISTDAELLERVRKALGIGIGLLEQQRENVVEGA